MLQEEVFGEIYDEEDREDDLEREELIKVVEEARVWAIQGNADLDDVCETLDMDVRTSKDRSEMLGRDTRHGRTCI